MTLPVPDFFSPQKVDSLFRVNYAALAAYADKYRLQHKIQASADDRQKNWLLLVDVQNTFCLPDFELYVGGRSGRGAVEDNTRLCQFIYRNLANINHISATLDTHSAMQIFHPIFFVDKNGNHPAPFTDIHLDELKENKWRFNAALAKQNSITPEYGQRMMIHYAEILARKGKYALTIWPYHAMLGGVGHALVSSIEEALFFHSVVRFSKTDFEVKGDKPFTENYSIIGPEVLRGPKDEVLGERNFKFIERLKQVDKLIIAGQAKSHCVAWTISDLLDDIQAVDPYLAKKVYLLEDCTSPVVVPGVVDHTDSANASFQRFAQAGMHVVKSNELDI